MTIRRVDTGRGHHYINTDTGARIPGVTTIIGDGLPKKALINWAAESTADYAVDHWDELTQALPSARLKALKGARYAVKDQAANRGTQIHKLGERLVKGEQVAIPDGLEGYVESYVRFLDEFNIQPHIVEGLIWSEEHNYCGSFDLTCTLEHPDYDPDEEWLLDLKTNRSGIFGETALQLAGYRYADHLIEDGEALPGLESTLFGAVHVRPDGYSLVPLTVDEWQFRRFLYAKQIAEFADTSRELVGEPVQPPADSVYQLTEVKTEEVLF